MRIGGRRTWLSDARGLAAVEFALIAAPLMVLIMGTFEVTLRMQTADEFERYAFQVGDVFSRGKDITSGDIDILYKAADTMMQQTRVETGMLDLDISSIGFQEDGEPVLLWRRHKGQKPPDFNLKEADRLAEPGETVLRISATLRYSPEIHFLTASGAEMSRLSYFKPRTTRAISVDGKIADPGVSWDFYGTVQ